jgi:hypothetical protein
MIRQLMEPGRAALNGNNTRGADRVTPLVIAAKVGVQAFGRIHC